jgi:hypothetical protein
MHVHLHVTVQWSLAVVVSMGTGDLRVASARRDAQITEEELSPLVRRLLVDVVNDGFTLRYCGGVAEPSAIVCTYDWDDYVDMVTLKGFQHVTAARVPKREKIDLFAPEQVVWVYQGRADRALLALLNLVHPDHPDAPRTAVPAPHSLHVPPVEQRPVTVRPPSWRKAGVRAARLAS